VAVRRRFAGRRGGAPKRSTFWTGGSLAISRIAPGTLGIYTVITEATLENVPNPTIVRSHLELICTDDESVSAADSAYTLVYGCGVVERNALAAGAAALPSPDTDQDWDGWFVHGALTGGAPTSGLTDSPLGVQRATVSSKAMRKVGQDEAVVLIIEPLTVLGTTGIQFWGIVRFLLKK